MTLNKSLFVCLDLHVASGTCGCSERAAGADQSRTVLPHHQNRLIAGFQHICPTFTRQIMKTPFFFRIRSTDGGEGAEAWPYRNLSCFYLKPGLK